MIRLPEPGCLMRGLSLLSTLIHFHAIVIFTASPFS